MITTRVARLSDADQVSRLTSQLGYEVTPTLVRTRLSGILERPDHWFVIAEDDGRAVGWVHGTVVEYVEAGRFVVIAGLVVDRNHRTAGIGRTLVQQVETWAREQGCSIVRLWSSAARSGAHAFYEALDYTRIKTQYSFAKSLHPARRESFDELVPRVDEQPAPDVGPVARTSAALLKAVNASDLAAVLAVWSDEGVMMPPHHPAVHGRLEIERYFERIFQKGRFAFSFTDSSIEVFGGSALERVQYTVTVDSVGGTRAHDAGKGVHLYRRQADGSWKLAMDIWNSDLTGSWIAGRSSCAYSVTRNSPSAR